jgi:hypothetical protein
MYWNNIADEVFLYTVFQEQAHGQCGFVTNEFNKENRLLASKASYFVFKCFNMPDVS